jgi:Tol biopolymer transport system component
MLCLLLPLGACGGGGGGGRRSGPRAGSAPLSVLHPIDGEVDLSAFEDVKEASVTLRDTSNQVVRTVALKWAVASDDRHVYFALEWEDPTYDHEFDIEDGPTDFDGVRIVFDDDGDGVREEGEDQRAVIAASVGSQYVDEHSAPGDETDLIADGFAKLRYAAAEGLYRAEFLIPLEDDAEGQDGPLSETSRYSITIFDHVELPAMTGHFGSAFESDTDSSGWPELPPADPHPRDHPELPDDLTGLVVFVSTHEEPNGEIYVFDPATREVTRVTTDPDMYKDNVSLSHDRTRIAFHGGTAADDYASWEIYTVGVDGADLTRLTDNQLLDGHPGWSPDDERVAYVSFRNPVGSSVVIVGTDGTELADLTPSGTTDSDPDYLPDGRLVVKTDRFSLSPEVRIAVMNEDGTGVAQLTFVDDVSDHDPVGDDEFTIFERFTKDTDYATDVETGFVPWNIVEARLDGTGEETLMADGWVNWLPVYDPSGRYVAYLKGAGYTAAHLMTRGGRDLGRLIPGVTRIRYLDWK